MIDTSKINVLVAFKNMDSSIPIRDYATKRAAKLGKHVHNITNCHFTFFVEKTQHVTELLVKSGDFEAHGEARAETMYAAIDEVVDKVVHQSVKYKEKTTDHTGRGHHNRSDQDDID